jgi:serpin B
MKLGIFSFLKIDLAGMKDVVRGNSAFALELYQKLRSGEDTSTGGTGNLFLSPYSISAALAMTYAGARGETQNQMARVLHFQEESNKFHAAFASLRKGLETEGKKGQVQLKIANALWTQKDYELQKDYLSLVKKFYGVSITSLDYGNVEAARDTINAWAEEKTDGKIKDMIAEGALDRMTRLVLANAIYFKGNWDCPFAPDQTREAPFTTASGDSVLVQMMNQKRHFRYTEDDELQILELPYTGNALSMVLLLPREINGLTKLEEILTVENLEKWSTNLAEREVKLSLPRFEITFPVQLDETLKSMGMLGAFSKQADFSGLEESRELYLGAALHKAFVTVNEEGTEAAAVTAVIMVTKAISMPAIFCADHPFVFLIRETSSGSLLFIGRVTNPA